MANGPKPVVLISPFLQGLFNLVEWLLSWRLPHRMLHCFISQLHSGVRPCLYFWFSSHMIKCQDASTIFIWNSLVSVLFLIVVFKWNTTDVFSSIEHIKGAGSLVKCFWCQQPGYCSRNDSAALPRPVTGRHSVMDYISQQVSPCVLKNGFPGLVDRDQCGLLTPPFFLNFFF